VSALLPSLHGYTASEVAACAMREVKKRQHVYPRLVLTQQMTQLKADREISMMTAMAEFFTELDERERLL